MGGPLMLNELERRRIEDEELRRSADAVPKPPDEGRSSQERGALLDRALFGFFVLFLGIGFLLFLADLLIP